MINDIMCQPGVPLSSGIIQHKRTYVPSIPPFFLPDVIIVYSGVSRQLFNWVQVIRSNRTGRCIKLAEVYYSIHDIVVPLIV